MKVCATCKIEKPVSDFGRCARHRDGLQYSCRSCRVALVREWRKSHRDQQRAWNKGSYERNKEKTLGRQKLYRSNPSGRAKVNAYARKWQKENPEKTRAYSRSCYRNNPVRFISKNRARKALKINATPAWSNPQYVSDFYMLARLVSEFTGIQHHVDHIVPLRSSRVCGFHSEYNLQVLPARDNTSKQNRVWPDMAV